MVDAGVFTFGDPSGGTSMYEASHFIFRCMACAQTEHSVFWAKVPIIGGMFMENMVLPCSLCGGDMIFTDTGRRVGSYGEEILAPECLN